MATARNPGGAGYIKQELTALAAAAPAVDLVEAARFLGAAKSAGLALSSAAGGSSPTDEDSARAAENAGARKPFTRRQASITTNAARPKRKRMQRPVARLVGPSRARKTSESGFVCCSCRKIR